ncbi:hypothetical protein IKE71_04160 [Candidatus Saccharibacteria bacterium]|nr:hypothetical protein [Candidatus Saccharibacteria bacterium]
MNGYIKLFRQMTEWEWYKEPNTKAVFLHLLIMANHSPGRWQGIKIDRGQHLTSIKKLAEETGLSSQNVRTALNHLKSTHELTITPTKRYTLITVEKYEKYQGDDSGANKVSNTLANKDLTNNQQRPNKQLTTNKNNKKEKEESRMIRNQIKLGEGSEERKTLRFADGEEVNLINGVQQYTEEETRRLLDANHKLFVERMKRK